MGKTKTSSQADSSEPVLDPQERRARRKEILAEKRAHRRGGGGGAKYTRKGSQKIVAAASAPVTSKNLATTATEKVRFKTLSNPVVSVAALAAEATATAALTLTNSHLTHAQRTPAQQQQKQLHQPSAIEHKADTITESPSSSSPSSSTQPVIVLMAPPPPRHFKSRHRYNNNPAQSPPFTAPSLSSRNRPPLSTVQIQYVDTIFEELFGYKWGTNVEHKKNMNNNNSSSSSNDQKQETISIDPMETYPGSTENHSPSSVLQARWQLLCQILGPQSAARLWRRKQQQQQQQQPPTRQSTSTNSSVPTRPLAFVMRRIPTHHKISIVPKVIRQLKSSSSSLPRLSGTTVTLTGNDGRAMSIPIPTRPEASSLVSNTSPPPVPATTTTSTTTITTSTPMAIPATTTSLGGGVGGGGGGVDDLLQKINDTGKVSTIAKTAQDWETFKADTGLSASLEEYTESKGAFLKKRDFLERVDQRKFERERTARERERFKNTKTKK